VTLKPTIFCSHCRRHIPQYRCRIFRHGWNFAQILYWLFWIGNNSWTWPRMASVQANRCLVHVFGVTGSYLSNPMFICILLLLRICNFHPQPVTIIHWGSRSLSRLATLIGKAALQQQMWIKTHIGWLSCTIIWIWSIARPLSCYCGIRLGPVYPSFDSSSTGVRKAVTEAVVTPAKKSKITYGKSVQIIATMHKTTL
jgi:hypothetical protein